MLVLAIALFTGCQDLDQDNQNSSEKDLRASKSSANLKFRDANLEEIFDLEALPVILLEVPLDNWNAILENYDEAPDVNYWTKGRFSYVKDGDTIALPDIALRLRGNSSRNRPEGDPNQPLGPHDPVNPYWNQASFSFNFGKYVDNQTFKGLEKLRLKYVREDPTRIREVYTFNLNQLYNIWAAPLISFCRFYIYVEGDPNPAYFGIYKLMEDLNEDYLSSRAAFFGDDAEGFLWKGDNGADFKNPDRNLMGVSTPEDPKVYDLKTHDKHLTEAQDQLIEFITNLNEKEGSDLKAWAESTMDVELFLKTYAVSVICGNVDDYWANSNNYSFYFNKNGKFFFIPNDFDTTLGTAWDIVPDVGIQNVLEWGGDNPLVRKLISIPEFRLIYINAFYELAEGPFNVNNSIPRIQKWQALIKDYLVDDTSDNTPFEDAPAFWSNQQRYRLLERGVNNYFEVRSATLPVRK